LQLIIDQTKNRSHHFFKSLTHITEILERTFYLLREGKLDEFDDATLQSLVSPEPEDYMRIKAQPKIYKCSTAKTVQ
jgi:hypothetical protein